VEAGGLGSGGAFTIAASVKAFEVLSSNLYQNKTLAVIREITCNAVDAHTAAGLPVSAIQVHLPTYLEPVFWVRDYGSGLSEEDVLSLYTTYFRSTKDQDNSQIGGFGLGSKSPFAVADQFTVTSWHGGFKSTYACYKQDGMPHVNAVGKEPCGPETGLEVRVPLTARSGSIVDWHTQARSLFRWWPDIPSLNTDVTQDDAIFDPDNMLLVSDTEVDGAPSWMVNKAVASSMVIMGNVPYTLNEGAIPDLPAAVNDLLGRMRLVIRVPMGSVSISPSRETLSYDATTIKYLKARLTWDVAEIVRKLEAELASCATLAEARERVHGKDISTLPGLFRRLKDIVKPRWNGKAVPETVSFKLHTAFSKPAQAFDYVKPGHWSTFRRDSYPETDPVFEHAFPKYESVVRLIMWTERVTAATFRKLRHHYMMGGKRIDVRLQVVSGIPYQELVDKCAEIGMPVPVNIDTALTAPPPVTSASVRVPSTQFYDVTMRDHNYSYTLVRDTLDLSGGGVYIRFAEGKPVATKLPYVYACLLTQQAFAPVRIIGLPSSKLAPNGKLLKALAANGWQELDTDYIQNMVDMPALLEGERQTAIHHLLFEQSGLRRNLVRVGMEDANAGSMWKGFAPVHAALQPHFALYLKAGSPLGHRVRRLDAVVLREVLTPAQWKQIEDTLAIKSNVLQAVEGFLKQHPLLTYVDGAGKLDVDAVREYVNR
jgi:hypothetical protein